MEDPKEIKKMANRMAIIKKLGEYFMKKGKVLSIKEYNLQEDKPMRHLIVKRVFNSWSRMEKYVMHHFPEIGTIKPEPVKEVKKVVPKKKVVKEVKEDE